MANTATSLHKNNISHQSKKPTQNLLVWDQFQEFNFRSKKSAFCEHKKSHQKLPLPTFTKAKRISFPQAEHLSVSSKSHKRQSKSLGKFDGAEKLTKTHHQGRHLGDFWKAMFMCLARSNSFRYTCKKCIEPPQVSPTRHPRANHHPLNCVICQIKKSPGNLRWSLKPPPTPVSLKDFSNRAAFRWLETSFSISW